MSKHGGGGNKGGQPTGGGSGSKSPKVTPVVPVVTPTGAGEPQTREQVISDPNHPNYVPGLPVTPPKQNS